MVIDLTKDSPSEDELDRDVKPLSVGFSGKRDEGFNLLQQFTRPRPRLRTSASVEIALNARNSTESMDGVMLNGQNVAVLNNEPSPLHFAVVVPSISSSDTSNKKRRLSSENHLSSPVNGVLGFPIHHDASELDFNIEFINEYKLQHGVARVEPDFHTGCRCDDKCDLHKCDHLSYEEESEDRIVPYQMGRGGTIVLRQDFLKRRAMIYECSRLCPCMPGCWNQVVQKGRTVKLEIFRTSNRGFGLRSPESIQSGQYIDRYLGEVITKKEADAREAAAGDPASYLFQLDFFQEDDECYIVDGKKYGSITRFMNHSCNPNCKMFPVSQYDAEQKIFDMAFFAIKDIPAGTELSFDYCPNYSIESSRYSDPQDVPCLCGEPNCRRKLWPNQRKTMQPEVE
ncbi:predicted protein [Histoplasma mississippiense (nom. inval.)]|nr:predicted protein [Histoplasma mississippiense (nom. inval.)]EDN03948.1 predicted protein [Histoplasma mississippiense (nom. inval.)]